MEQRIRPMSCMALRTGATGLLALSVFGDGIIGIGEMKNYLRDSGVTLR